MTEPEYVTTEQAATALHVTPETVRRWCRQRVIVGTKIAAGGSGKYLIARSEITRKLAEQ